MPCSAAVFCAGASDAPSPEMGLNGRDPEQSYLTEHGRCLLHITQHANGDNICRYETDCIKLTCLIKLARLSQNTVTRDTCILCTCNLDLAYRRCNRVPKFGIQMEEQRQVHAKAHSKVFLFCQVHQLLSHLCQDSGALSHVLKVLPKMECYTIYYNQLHLGKWLLFDTQVTRQVTVSRRR